MAASARNPTNRRLYLLGAMLAFWSGAICLRLVYLQIFSYGVSSNGPSISNSAPWRSQLAAESSTIARVTN